MCFVVWLKVGSGTHSAVPVQYGCRVHSASEREEGVL